MGPGEEGIGLSNNTGNQREIISGITLPGLCIRENWVLSARFLGAESYQLGSVYFLSGLQGGTHKPQSPLCGFLPPWELKQRWLEPTGHPLLLF